VSKQAAQKFYVKDLISGS